MRHYHVLSGLRGCYMPDDNQVCKTLSEARACAKGLADMARSDEEKVTGSAKSGYYRVGEYNCIEITACTADCNTEEG